MRLIQVTIPADRREAVLDLLDKEGIDYVLTDEVSSREYDSVVYFPVPQQAVEPILDSLQQAGIAEDSYTVVLDAETVVSERFEELQEEYDTGSVERDQISRQELVTRAGEITPTFSVFLTMTLISAVVATVGLLLDSPAVVVGSMVIAPLIGPALGASIGTVVNDRGLFLTGLRYQFAGIVGGIAASAIFAFALQSMFLVPPGTEITQIDEIAERIIPELLLLPVALGAGVAGVLSLATGFSMAIVGVMIAAALIPPMAATGIALAWGLPGAALGSAILVFVNLLGVNLAGILTLWYIGYRPSRLFEIAETRRHVVKRVGAFAIAVLVLSLFLGSITYTSYQVSTFEQMASTETEAAIEDREDIEVLSVSVNILGERPFVVHSLGAAPQIDTVQVELGGRSGNETEIAEEIDDRINRQTDYEIDVEVSFIRMERP